MTLLITTLAVYRLTRLVVDDAVFDTPRLWIASKHRWFDSVLSCYWCAGFWISVAATLTLYYTSTVDLPAVAWWFLPFAFSAVAGILGDKV